MSKYDALWEHVEKENQKELSLTFEEIENILGFPIDHSFLRFKKELLLLGFEVGKISMKEKTVKFFRIGDLT